MTAEIAILNKTAVALAADSAVTISAGSKEEKIFDSADKLFELSLHNPIGIMIYNGMNFMEAPLPLLIRNFRQQCGDFARVQDAAQSFLAFLNDFGRQAPRSIKDAAVGRIFDPVLTAIRDRFMKKMERKIAQTEDFEEDFKTAMSEIMTEAIDVFHNVFERQPEASFVGRRTIKFNRQVGNLLSNMITERLPPVDDEQRGKLISIGQMALTKAIMSRSKTGIVIAGFGSSELFPTLISFEIDGVVCDHLKFIQTNHIDIDRSGPKARVLPFAQKEMVERFLYGLDGDIQKQISSFCKETVPNIKTQILDKLDFSDDADKQQLNTNAEEAEEAFLKGLREQAFEQIRSQSEAEIEDMVEFMPKPELAKMAEALVNLTSIKRRVTRGMETVGGPIDVAVISQSEGFVWIKRKHYFPAELNARYFQRLPLRPDYIKEKANGHDHEIGDAGADRGDTVEKAPRKRRSVPSAPKGG